MPTYPEHLIRTVAEVRLRQYGTEYDNSHLTWRDFADDASEILGAAAPALAEACAEAILAHRDTNGPQVNGAGRRAWRRQFGIAARVAAGRFTTDAEKLRQAGEALTAALATGQVLGCNPEAAMIAAAERDGTLTTVRPEPEDMAAHIVRSAVSERCQWGHHDRCGGSRVSTAPATPPTATCECPRHQDPAALCWGDISRVQVRP